MSVRCHPELEEARNIFRPHNLDVSDVMSQLARSAGSLIDCVKGVGDCAIPDGVEMESETFVDERTNKGVKHLCSEMGHPAVRTAPASIHEIRIV